MAAHDRDRAAEPCLDQSGPRQALSGHARTGQPFHLAALAGEFFKDVQAGAQLLTHRDREALASGSNGRDIAGKLPAAAVESTEALDAPSPAPVGEKACDS